MPLSCSALGFLLIWSIIEGVIYGFLKWEMLRNTNLADNIMQLFPLASMSNLIKEPFSRLGAVKNLAKQIGENFTKNYEIETSSILIVSVWTFIFIYLSYALLKKRDL